MESFLASRPAVTKLGSSAKPGAGGVFVALGEQKQTAAAVIVPLPAASGAAGPEAHAGHAVRVEVIRADGVAKRVVVHCGCGEVIELDCLYQD